MEADRQAMRSKARSKGRLGFRAEMGAPGSVAGEGRCRGRQGSGAQGSASHHTSGILLWRFVGSVDVRAPRSGGSTPELEHQCSWECQKRRDPRIVKVRALSAGFRIGDGTPRTAGSMTLAPFPLLLRLSLRPMTFFHERSAEQRDPPRCAGAVRGFVPKSAFRARGAAVPVFGRIPGRSTPALAQASALAAPLVQVRARSGLAPASGLSTASSAPDAADTPYPGAYRNCACRSRLELAQLRKDKPTAADALVTWTLPLGVHQPYRSRRARAAWLDAECTARRHRQRIASELAIRARVRGPCRRVSAVAWVFASNV